MQPLGALRCVGRRIQASREFRPHIRIFDRLACAGALFFDDLTWPCGVRVAFDLEAARFGPAERPCANRAAIPCNRIAATEGLCRACTRPR